MKFFRSLLSVILATCVLLFGTLTPLSAQDVWVGNANPDPNWSNGANWQSGSAPLSNSDLHFQGSNQTTNNNDYAPNGISIGSLTFDANAAAFTLQGNPISFFVSGAANTITNNSANLQTLNFVDTGAFGGITPAGAAITIDAASGDFAINSNIRIYNFAGETNVTFTGSHTTTVTGVIDDSGALAANVVKSGSGTLILANNNTFRDFIRIDGGVLGVQAYHALGSGSTVLNNGTLQVNGGMAAFFAVGDGSQAVSDYFQNGGTLRIQVGGLVPGLNADQMQVFGAAHLSSELFVHQLLGFMPTPGDRVTILATMAGVNGTFDSVNSDFPGLIQPTADYFSDHVDVVFTLGSFVFSGLTPNQEDVAQELNEVANDGRAAALVTFLGNQPLANLPRDYDLIAPEELASIYEIGFSQAVIQNSNLQRRMDDIRAGSNGYGGPTVEIPREGKDYNPPIQDKNVVVPDKNVVPSFVSCPENQWNVFATGSGDFVNVGDRDENAPGYDLTTGSVTAGADYRVGSHFAIGLDGNYASSRADLVDGGRVDVDGGQIGAYATVFGNGLWGSRLHIDGAVNGGWNSYDTRRIGLQGATVRGSTDGSEFNAFLSYGSDWTFGHLNIGTWSTLQYTNVQINRFTEEGSLAPLEIQDQDEDSLRATSGIRASYDIRMGRCAILRPEVRAAYQHEYGNPSYMIDSRFASGAGDVFRVHGPTIGRDSALVGAGFNMQWCARFSTYVYYDGVLGRSNYDNNAVSGGLRIGF